MKNKNYRESKLKHQLRELQHNGKKSVVWKLSSDQVVFVKQFYRVEPELYQIHTKLFSKTMCDSYPILKYLRNEKVFNNHDYLVTRLKKSDKSVLDEFGIHYSVLKYRIHLV